MASSVAVSNTVEWRWLRNAQFDLTFIVGVALAGIAAGLLVSGYPQLFWFVLLFDLWFLGYHHVISTYTRLCFDKKSLSESRFLIFGLMPLVAVATALCAWLVGLWAVVSIYFYWQWFHYTRQSWGVSRAYRAKDREALYEDGWLDQAIFYALPVLGIVYRSYQDPGTFIGFKLQVVPVHAWVLTACSVAAAALLAYWVVRRIQAWRMGRLSAVHTLYVASHFAIFAVGYILIENATYGWLAINIWHNAQYILFVWLFNTRRFKDGVNPDARFLSYISQPQRLWLYLLVGVGITIVVYVGLLGMLGALFFAGLSATLVLYQIVNFHHYIVDSMIWKVRKPAISNTLGLGARP